MTESESQDRIKTAMILYEIERELGRYIRKKTEEGGELHGQILTGIAEREEERGRQIDPGDPSEIIASTYMDELLAFAASVAPEGSEKEAVSRLQNLFRALELFDVRNAVAHPNRPFPPSYWHRAASVATDWSIDMLQLSSVGAAYRNAKRGRVEAPPEEWLLAPTWSLVHNLPDSFDHDLTGLIGRRKELEELEKLLENPRILLIGVIGQGGLGKTALVLEALKALVVDPRSARHFDQLVFVSAKNERLEAEGVKAVSNAVIDLDAVKKIIAEKVAGSDSFEDALETAADTRILLVIDNLETLLRDSPQLFEGFYRELPPKWKVLVTSRVGVDSATVFTVGPLPKGGAINLASRYSRRRGAELPGEALEGLVESCDYNPLGIRLTVDSVAAGVGISEAVSGVRKEVVQYSFKNLVERLPEGAKNLLEFMFVWDGPLSRSRLSSILDKPADQIADALRQLTSTTLVSRFSSEGQEHYELSSSVRYLLLLHPADPDARQQARKRVRRLKTSSIGIEQIQEHREIHPLDPRYIPEGLAPDLQVPVYEALAKADGRGERADLAVALTKVQQLLESYPDHPLLHRAAGLLRIRLDDVERGKASLRSACRSDPPDWPAMLVLTRQLKNDADYEEAQRLGRQLFEAGWAAIEKTDFTSASAVIQAYLLPMIFMGEWDEALELTQDWRDQGELHIVYGSMRVTALRNSVDFMYGGDIDLVDARLGKACEILSELINEAGCAGLLVVEGMKVCKQIGFRASKDPQPSPETVAKLTQFMADHLVGLCASHRYRSLDDSEVQRWIRAAAELDQDANALDEGLISQTWKVETEQGELPFIVYHRPQMTGDEHQRFLFLRDETGKQYFLHMDYFEGTRQEWEKIGIDDFLLGIPTDDYHGDGAWPMARARVSD